MSYNPDETDQTCQQELDATIAELARTREELAKAQEELLIAKGLSDILATEDQRLCLYCGFSKGKHRAMFSNCPKTQPQLGKPVDWLTTSFVAQDSELAKTREELKRSQEISTKYEDRWFSLREELAKVREQAIRAVRGEFSQICAYCGWEAKPDGAQWDELQQHIKECTAHPLRQVEQELAKVTRERDDLHALNGQRVHERDTLRAELDTEQAKVKAIVCPECGLPISEHSCPISGAPDLRGQLDTLREELVKVTRERDEAKVATEHHSHWFRKDLDSLRAELEAERKARVESADLALIDYNRMRERVKRLEEALRTCVEFRDLVDDYGNEGPKRFVKRQRFDKRLVDTALAAAPEEKP